MLYFSFQKQYLQVVLPYLANITTIITQGNVTSYTLKVSKEGKKFRDYDPSGTSKQMVGTLCFFTTFEFSRMALEMRLQKFEDGSQWNFWNGVEAGGDTIALCNMNRL